MASSKSPGWPEYSFIATLVLALGLGLGWFLEARDKAERLAAQAKSKEEATSANKAATTALEQIDALKKATGHTYEDVGAADPNKPNTVMNAITTEITQAAPDVAERTYTAAMAKLTTDVRTLTTERDDLRKKLDDLNGTFIGLEDKYKAVVKQVEDAKTQAEQDLTAANTSKTEELAKKDTDIDELKKAYTDAQAEFDLYKESSEKTQKDLNNRVKNLVAVNTKLNDRLMDLERTSFEQPDGVVRLVDNSARTVFINLGEVDRLPLRTTFSVYDQGVPGVARGPKDVKGSIEVVRVLGPHMAEARINDSSIFAPIAPGDLVYTPLWSPGRAEKFAVIGTVDLDGDGTPDRDLLHELVNTVGAEIAVEVDNNGNRTGGEITEEIKFFVRGKVPTLDEASDVEEQKRIERVNDQLTRMLNEAREHGVQVKSMNEFLTYVGYKPNRRVYRPGESTPFNLKAGARSPSVDSSKSDVGRPSSSGSTSAAVSGDRNLKPKTSTGTTSKLFRGGR
jgi:hypothetical protein